MEHLICAAVSDAHLCRERSVTPGLQAPPSHGHLCPQVDDSVLIHVRCWQDEGFSLWCWDGGAAGSISFITTLWVWTSGSLWRLSLTIKYIFIYLLICETFCRFLAKMLKANIMLTLTHNHIFSLKTILNQKHFVVKVISLQFAINFNLKMKELVLLNVFKVIKKSFVNQALVVFYLI